ncbi:MAG: class I SAM-dependent methyltransferase [Pseudomonadota bacterium]|nr:class I SAM-dependent methyltransferase [Pseudomonadota bacterium]
MDESTSILRLSEFLRSPAGQYVLDWEQLQLDAAVVDIFGYHALQLGFPDVDALRENRMPLRFCAANRLSAASSESAHPTVAVINRYEELPFATHSIDLVVMPHILEFTEDPHQVLREVERVLVPEGHVVITGFNPASLWGVRQYLTRLGASPYLPREGRFLSLHRVKDWLKLLSFDVERGRFGCYVPSVRREQWLARWQFMEKAGDRWWPILGAIYMLTAVKRVRGMRLIGAVWKGKEEPARLLSPAATTRTFLTGEANSALIDLPDAANDGARTAARR